MIVQTESEGYYPVLITDKHKLTSRHGKLPSKQYFQFKPSMEAEGRQHDTAKGKSRNTNEALEIPLQYKAFIIVFYDIIYLIVSISVIWIFCEIAGFLAITHIANLPLSLKNY